MPPQSFAINPTFALTQFFELGIETPLIITVLVEGKFLILLWLECILIWKISPAWIASVRLKYYAVII